MTETSEATSGGVSYDKPSLDTVDLEVEARVVEIRRLRSTGCTNVLPVIEGRQE